MVFIPWIYAISIILINWRTPLQNYYELNLLNLYWLILIRIFNPQNENHMSLR